METLIPLSDDWRPAETIIAPLEKADRPAIWALAVILAADLAIFLYVVVTGFVRQPFSDMFDFLRAEFEWERSGDLLAYLASLHNQQHLVWVRILTALDVQVFHGTAVIFLIASSLSILVAAAAIAVEILRSTPVRVVGALAALIAAPLIVSTVNAMDCTQPINCVYPIAFVFTVLSIILFEQIEPDALRRTVPLGAIALVCALAAFGGSGAGVAVFPALIVSTVRNPGARSLIVPTLVVGLLALVVVLAPLLGAGVGQPSDVGPDHIWKMADYFLVYAGMPWSAVDPLSVALSRVRLVIGLLTIAIGAALLWRGSRRHGAAGRLERIGLDLILFSLITGVMAALGRVDENGAVIVPLRYAVFMSAFQVGVICVVAPAVAERWASAKQYAVPAALVVAVALLTQQVVAGSSVVHQSQFIRAEISAFTAGERRPEMHHLIYPDCKIACNSDPLRGHFRVQYRPL